MADTPDEVVLHTDLAGLQLVGRGKVRDLYDLDEHLLIVTTDRLSAFDVVFPQGIPGKGKVLTELSQFWFGRLQSIVPHHLVTTDVDAMPAAVRRHADILRGRTMLARKCTVFPVECVVRGYLIGSGWKDYKAAGSVCGLPLPAGLRMADRLPEVLFTPATKAETGHDENIDFATMAGIVGADTAARLRELSVRVFETASAYAAERGILLADTKFEFGRDAAGNITLIDEVLTPDSSRYWPAEDWKPGASPPSFDKQIVRDWIETTDWNKSPPAPRLPDAVIQRTAERYREILDRLTRS
jgi:phosphoribosylaminoimidazole-succinocarboxamide synthase